MRFSEFPIHHFSLFVGLICIILLGLLSYITNMQTVEGIIRAEAVTTMATAIGIEKSRILSDPHYVKERLIGM